MEFSNEEYRDMYYMYGMAHGSSRRAVELYRARFPNRRVPSHEVILRLHRRMADEGCLAPRRREGRPVGLRRQGLEDDVLNAIERDPTSSTRRIAAQVGSDRSTVYRILQQEQMHPYHPTPTQELLPADHEHRMDFCQFILDRNRCDPYFLYNVCWSDESCFTREGIFNPHNYHYWDTENPHLARAHSFQRQWQRLNVWGAILGDEIHLRLAPDPLNGENYLQFLQTNLDDIIGDGPAGRHVWFQQDGAPAHSIRAVTDYLDEIFPERWIGRQGPVRWPPRSPDLTPMDFFLWGHLKEEIYQQASDDTQQLVARLHAAVEMITPQQMEAVRRGVVRRAEECLENGGGLFEHLR